MAYFNHAFCKSFLVDEVVDLTATANQTTSDLTAGQLGVVDGSWVGQDPAALSTTPANNLFYIAQGSFMPNDKIGTHGGYQESVKTKGINPRYVTRLWTSVCQDAQASTVTINVDETCAPCGDLFYLRLDVKGSPALRFLNHNAYAIGDSSGSAALNNNLPGICCVDGQEFLDPAVALAKAAGMLLEDPIITPFAQEAGASVAIVGPASAALNGAATLGAVSAGGTTYVAATNVATTGGTGTGLTLDITVVAGVVTAVAINNPGNGYTALDVITITGGDGAATTSVATVSATTGSFTIAEVLDGTYTPSTDPVTDGVTASVTFQGAYVDTQFGDCSFDTRDHYEMEPVQLFASILDETGDPCNECGSTTRTEGVMAQTHGETVLRHILLHERYLQSPYHQGASDSVRIREIEGFDAIKAAVQRNALYKVYYIQHSIPRLNNPTGTFDNDQYVYQFFVPCLDQLGATNPVIAEMDALFTQLETVCGTPFGNPVDFNPLGIDQL